ncbi:MAG: hypothetical protein J6V65_03395, partial [Fibrobacterales bacterium]|nr:hypothetical protein [Fibrobacterales bacterium]
MRNPISLRHLRALGALIALSLPFGQLTGCSQGDLWEPDEKEVYKRQTILADEWVPTKSYPSQPEAVSSADTVVSSAEASSEEPSSSSAKSSSKPSSSSELSSEESSSSEEESSSSSAIAIHQLLFVADSGGVIYRTYDDGERQEVSGSRQIEDGESLVLTFSANVAWKLDSVTLNDVRLDEIEDSTYTDWSVSENQTWRAFFSRKSYTITAGAGANGSVNPAGQFQARYG